MKTVIILLILLSATPAVAVNVETLIAPANEPLRAGQNATIGVYIHNMGERTTVMNIPDRVTCLLTSKNKSVQATAYAEDPVPGDPMTIAAMAFLKLRYVFFVPEGFSGPVRLEIAAFENAAVLVSVSEAPPILAVEKSTESMESESDILPTLDDIQTLYQPYLVNLWAYNPMYFLVGTNPENSKFQVSFKYRFFNPEGSLAERIPWISGLHFAYTQTSFWDLKSDSQPFEDTSYKPEFFLVTPNIRTSIPWNRGFFMQGGFQHDSNGRGGDLSRNTNFLYLKPIFVFYDEV